MPGSGVLYVAAERAVHSLAASLSTSRPGVENDGLRPGLSADQVTPGFLGFAMTAFMVISVVLLMVSMTRRIRRVRYRSQFSDQALSSEALSPQIGSVARGEIPSPEAQTGQQRAGAPDTMS